MRAGAIGIGLAVLAAFGTAGCATGGKGKASEPGPKQAVMVSIAAAPDLNTFNNQPHTVVVVLYQLADANVFRQLTESPEGLGKLLEGESFDASVLSRRKMVLQPGQSQQLSMDLQEGARYLGAAGGFYAMRADSASRLYPIELQKKGMLFWSKTEPLGIQVELGKSGFIK